MDSLEFFSPLRLQWHVKTSNISLQLVIPWEMRSKTHERTTEQDFNLDQIWNLSSPLKPADVHISVFVWFPTVAISGFFFVQLQSGRDMAVSVLHNVRLR